MVPWTGCPRISFRNCRALVSVVAVVSLGMGGGAWGSKVGKGSNIPSAHSASVSVYRNAPAEIELSATTSSLLRLEFLIREEPGHGKLSEIKPVAGDNRKVRVVYTPDLGSTAGLDRFKFTAQVPGEAPSPAAMVEIRILEPRPLLAVEAPVQFRKVRVGEVGRAAFVVRNVGQSVFRSRIELLSPWELDRDVLEVEPGASERVTVEFRPLVPGKVGTRLQLQAEEDSSVVGIFGEAVAPFSVTPGTVELGGTTAGEVRRARLVLENATTEPVVVSLHAAIDQEHPSSRLVFPEKVEIGAEGKAEMELSLPAGELGALEEVLTFSSKVYSVEVPVVAKAFPARLVVEEPASGGGWNFGKIPVGEAAGAQTFVLANLGGAALVANVTVAPPFVVEGTGQSIEVGGGERIKVEVRPETKNAGVFRSDLVVAWADGELKIPLSLEVELPESVTKPEGEVATGTGAPPVPGVGRGTGGEGGAGDAGTSVSAKTPVGMIDLTGQDTADVLFDAYAAHYGLPLTSEPFYAKFESVKKVNLVKGDHRSVELSWEKASARVDNYVVEMSKMYRDTENGGKLVKRWIPWQGEIKRLEDAGSQMVVRLEPLLSGTDYEFRVVARDAKGRKALPSEPIVLLTGVPEPLWKKVGRWLLVPLGLFGVFVGYRLVQAYRGRSEIGKLHAGSGEHGGIRGVWEGLRNAIFR